MKTPNQVMAEYVKGTRSGICWTIYAVYELLYEWHDEWKKDREQIRE